MSKLEVYIIIGAIALIAYMWFTQAPATTANPTNAASNGFTGLG